MECRLPIARLREFAVNLARRPELDRNRWSGPAMFVGIVASDDVGLTVAVQPVEPPDAHPSELLPHLDVPDDWLALGLVAFGWARSLDDWDQPRRRAHTVDLFDRRGAGVAVVSRQGDTEPLVIEHRPGDGNDPVGLMADGLRRALGLPTPRCEVSVLEYCARSWLFALLDASTAVERLSWARAASLHPGVAGVRSGAAARLVGAGLELDSTVTWGRLRAAAAHDFGPDADISAELASWMDDDMFARALVARAPSLDELLERLTPHLSRAVLRHVVETLDAWGLRYGDRQAAC